MSPNQQERTPRFTQNAIWSGDFFLFPFFSTGLVRLYIAGLPLRSCWTIGLPSVGGSPNVRFSFLVTSGFEPTSWVLPCRRATTAPLWPPRNIFFSHKKVKDISDWSPLCLPVHIWSLWRHLHSVYTIPIPSFASIAYGQSSKFI